MSLDYDLSDVRDSDDLCFVLRDGGAPKYEMSPVTYAIIHMTMLVDMGSVTEENHEEFFIRCSMYEKLFGAAFSRMPDYEDVKAHAGLITNVSTQDAGRWWKRMGESLQYSLMHKHGVDPECDGYFEQGEFE
jgi:hypothetical protein